MLSIECVIALKRRIQVTNAEKFKEVFGVKVDVDVDCGFFDCSDISDCENCILNDYNHKIKDWWNAPYKGEK